MIYDCFTFFNELELLDVRLHELSDVVDYFVLVESDITHQHAPKPLYFEENKHQFEEFLPRIKHIVVKNAPRTSSWATENFQRMQIIQGLSECADDDIIIISDLDEIPSADAVIRYTSIPDPPLMSLQQSLHYYYFNCWAGGVWTVAKILPYKSIKESSIQFIRVAGADSSLTDAGWHFTYMGDEDRIINKLRSFAHTNFNVPEFLDPERLRQEINRGQDIITDSNKQFVLRPVNASLPQYVVDNQDKFAHLIRREPFLNFDPAPSSDSCDVSCTSTKVHQFTK